MRILITGGCGFIGTNLSEELARSGHEIVIFDNLSRPQTEYNLEWLRSNNEFVFIQADVRDYASVREAMDKVDLVFHLAAQVAVTTSIRSPREDFEINALGTLNILEAMREIDFPPILVYASTNKVYGALEDLNLVEEINSYKCADMPMGVPESFPLDFHSPYGCSKGTADQYVRDYSRIYGLRTVVLRQSCIYGPHQFGVEDQGWLSHFIISAEANRPITIYGNGKQVRDLLHVSDLITLYSLVVENIDHVSGEIFNVGGGPANTISIWQEMGPVLEELTGHRVIVRYSKWRSGDQPWFVADIRKAQKKLNWTPRVSVREGIRDVYRWVKDNWSFFANNKV